MPTKRSKLFSAAAVFAIAMVAGAWTTSTRGGEDRTISINLLMDGYDDGSVPTKMQNTLCIFHVTQQGGQAPYDVDWSGHFFNYSGSSLNEDEYLGTTSGTQYVTVTDDNEDWDSDSIYVPVSSSGAGCEA
jgi:hypothetical protein